MIFRLAPRGQTGLWSNLPNKMNLYQLMRMKLSGALRYSLATAVAAICFLLGPQLPTQADDTQPVITAIRLEGTNVVVTVRVPTGLKKIMLEGKSRLDRGAWVPRAVKRIADATGATLEFKLPLSDKLETLRVRADRDEPLVDRAYQATTEFAATPGSPTMDGRNTLGFEDGAVPSAGESGSTREVVESDIWKRSGDTLYFFNQFRGLQIIDVSQPDLPALRGQIALPAAGDQMYLLGTSDVILLARDDCSYGVAGPESQVVLVDVADPAQPQIRTRLGLGGYIGESRLVGTALYLATQSYRSSTNATGEVTWEWGTSVTSFDFADPTAPTRGDSLWFSGWGHVIQATDRFLFLAHTTPNWGWPMEVEIVDISDPHGAMKHMSKVKVAGNIADKFKINLNGDVLTVVSFAWEENRRWVTTLETFSLTVPETPRALGRLELAEGEQLHATRFDGDRVYIVTFLRIDPLWVIDLSDPARPRIAGELEVPGWSTYIQPLGDRLVSIGIDPTNGWRVAVSLFDVRDPAKPALYDKVLLGENHSWSEANYDEKAFSVMDEAGLILVPYQGYLTNGLGNRIQLIDLGANTLKLRGQIEHTFQPRRATLHRDRIYSISGTELLAVDATDRDHPLVRATVELSWSVDRTILVGPYVLQVTDGASTGGGWYFRGWSSETQPPAIRVALAARSDQILGEWRPETQWPIVGTVRKDNRLYVLQGFRPDYTVDPTQVEGSTNVVLTTLDLSKLPELPVLDQAGAAVGTLPWGATFQALWPTANVLVWSEQGGSYYYWDWWMVDGLPGRGIEPGLGGDLTVSPPPFWYPWGGGGGTGRLLSYDPQAARWLPEIASMGGTNAWSYSLSHAAEGLVFASHVTYETVTNIIDGRPYEQWMSHQWLDVVDFADPSSPTVRPPTALPGQLVGLSHQGAVVYTQGVKTWDTNDTSGLQWLAALAYDGVSAHWSDAISLPTTWPQPLLGWQGAIYLNRINTDNSSAELEIWQLSAATARLTRLGSTSTSPNSYTLAPVGNYLGGTDGRAMTLIDVSDPSAPKLWLKGELEGCISGTLDQADATPEQGLLLPLGNYGVGRIPPP